MLTDKLSKSLKSDLEQLLSEWTQEIKNSEYMISYQKLSDKDLVERGKIVLQNFVLWLENGADNKAISIYFEEVGAARLKEEIPLTDIVIALFLTKKILRNYLRSLSFLKKANTDTVFECNNLLSTFFDLGNFFISKGYTQKLYESLNELKKLSSDEFDAVLKNSFLQDDDFYSDDIFWDPVK